MLTQLQQHLPLAVLKPKYYDKDNVFFHKLQQHLPLAVLKLAIYLISFQNPIISKLQQHLPPAVCVAECEAAEERSDDEARTSQVPERREGKTKAISNSTYCLRYAPKGARQQRSKATMRSAHRKYLSEAKIKQM